MRHVLAGLALTLVLVAAAVPSVGTQAPPPMAAEARIKIDADRVIGQVDPLLFGNFAEHLGRMIYGGIYEEGSPLADHQGYRKDVLEAVKGLNVTILRWPGGNFASAYNWKDGIGPRDRRPARPEPAWGAVESNRFGTDEFLQYAEKIGAEPYICLNLGLGTIDDARHWVEYTNGTKATYWADQRRTNGRAAPYNVKYWALGNEIDGPWQMGHKNAEEYAKVALDVWVSSPTYAMPNRTTLPYLDVSATIDPASRTLHINVLNRSKDRDIRTRIENQEGRLEPSARVWELNHSDLKATHTFGADTKVRPVERNVPLVLDGQGFAYTFPAHSLTVIKVRVNEGGGRGCCRGRRTGR